ncbi:MAG: hypothetical protein KME05_00465 [Gloeocapsa sp. UFS-A4-WI-NPMV-4B04]|jgi:uncharacterized membrane-anchored protein|nr:hypothetical protein [Gloeocapsa sp. UFS-A4-WI-NPMV-4B04]
MATINKLMKQMNQESVSWGSIMLLICGLGVLISMMVMYSGSYPVKL